MNEDEPSTARRGRSRPRINPTPSIQVPVDAAEVVSRPGFLPVYVPPEDLPRLEQKDPVLAAVVRAQSPEQCAAARRSVVLYEHIVPPVAPLEQREHYRVASLLAEEVRAAVEAFRASGDPVPLAQLVARHLGIFTEDARRRSRELEGVAEREGPHSRVYDAELFRQLRQRDDERQARSAALDPRLLDSCDETEEGARVAYISTGDPLSLTTLPGVATVLDAEDKRRLQQTRQQRVLRHARAIENLRVVAADEAGSRGYLGRAFVACGLPHTNPGDLRVYTRRNGPHTLTVYSDLPLPFGKIPRVFLWLGPDGGGPAANA